MSDPALKPWWGSTTFAMDQQRRWQIGPLTLWIERRPGEWRVATARVDDWSASPVKVAELCEQDLDAIEHLTRVGAGDDEMRIVLRPRVADRDIVTRPERPFLIQAGDEVTMFVGTPLCFEVAIEGRKDRLLCEQPIFPISRTWFGPDSSEGEICYASRTFCRLVESHVITVPHRSTSAVHIRNHGQTTLNLARMLLPVTRLSLYADERAQVWTEEITLTRTGDDTLTQMERKTRAPAHMTRISGPRVTETSFLLRAFSPLIGSSSFQDRHRSTP